MEMVIERKCLVYDRNILRCMKKRTLFLKILHVCNYSINQSTIPNNFDSRLKTNESKIVQIKNVPEISSHRLKMMTSRRWWRIKIRCTLLGGGKQEGNSRRIQRHRTLNRNANVLTKSEILRNAARLRTSSTCPENLRPVTEFSSWNIHPAYLRPVHITLPSPLLSLPPFHPFSHSSFHRLLFFSLPPLQHVSFLPFYKFYQQSLSWPPFPAKIFRLISNHSNLFSFLPFSPFIDINT